MDTLLRKADNPLQFDNRTLSKEHYSENV